MADAMKVISFLSSEKTDKKEMDGGYKESDFSHFLFAVRKDRQKGNGWRMQRKWFPSCCQKRHTNRKWCPPWRMQRISFSFCCQKLMLKILVQNLLRYQDMLKKILMVSHHVIFWRCHYVVKKLLRWHIVLSMQLYLNGIALVICNCNEPMVTATESQHDMIFNLSKALLTSFDLQWNSSNQSYPSQSLVLVITISCPRFIIPSTYYEHIPHIISFQCRTSTHI